ncbi:hypothetical protein GLOTRDRAFT_50923 [Gloeophyllum trabeum ATCC 11539]|uniref:CxC2-like cysteine cluster KDZ transposase-associated domain-containing protein n=1 Tax=Gloeophyllum trabeum (strain ATCC 11539 / FP-39264 / Madison 617) TaxID=670483 RepID=S7R726_GLOTA|nr:uncharacterized protein GLOTRDRAFT_50923 [Gloeophyllum trabeum ATCC 11539]EPQ50190.1 hypothetical protein GLOTRDRAFT_50923 [Gloeophyllum trabeum ATCC 11539]
MQSSSLIDRVKFAQASRSSSSARPQHPRSSQSPAAVEEVSQPQHDTSIYDDTQDHTLTFRLAPEPPDGERARRRRKKENQSARWRTEVIPALTQPFLQLLQRTNWLRERSPIRNCSARSCECPRRPIKILAIHFNHLKTIELDVCPCRPSYSQLLEQQLFPCAPLFPSLAVDLNVLEFVSHLFVELPPNNTAWCNAVETFLQSRSYAIASKDCLRRRFSNALSWYHTLRDTAEKTVHDWIQGSRPCQLLEGMHQTDDSSPGLETPTTTRAMSGTTADLQRPSEYLRSRCPACFGGQTSYDPTLLADYIVEMDACFSQKRQKGSHDPKNSHPDTVWLSEDTAAAMEAEVERLRAHNPSGALKKHTGQDKEVADDEDGFEGTLKVPKSALDECDNTFTAADEKRKKASTSLYDDTGIMALNCRHDVVLWLVNMRSAGEKQFYALALLKELFNHLPPKVRVGLLYDVACSLHRSCLKWGYLPEYIDRLVFGISVFHAYGHQWPCQLVYHPRKCEGFGLSNGEGCERLWLSLMRLVPCLRVSGYHQRLYVLDSQVHHRDAKIRRDLGQWLFKHTEQLKAKRAEARAAFGDCGIAEETLRSEWTAQIKAQTQPLPRRAKNKGKDAVANIIRLQARTKVLAERAASLEKIILDDTTSQAELVQAEMRLTDVRTKLSREQALLKAKERELGVDGRADLQRLRNSKYLTHRLNALALKKRLRERLRQRKFELERVERAYRNLANDKRIHSHTETQVKRREPGIQQLARDFNGLCGVMRDLIRKGQAPPGSVAPDTIDSKALFKLDVDDTIWQDVGLDEDPNSGESIPPWLGDDAVRTGIRAWVELQRCQEEEKRLRRERRAIQEWFAEEWEMVSKAEASAGTRSYVTIQGWR